MEIHDHFANISLHHHAVILVHMVISIVILCPFMLRQAFHFCKLANMGLTIILSDPITM